MTPDNEKEAKVLRYFGLACRSRRAALGTNLVLAEVRKAGACDRCAVLLAFDASERTKKQISDKCAFYRVPLFEISGTDTLASATGKQSAVSAVCVTDPSLSKAIKEVFTGENR